MVARADLARLKLEKMQENLAPVEQVKTKWRQVKKDIRRRCMLVPGRVGKQCSPAIREQVERLLRAEISTILREEFATVPWN